MLSDLSWTAVLACAEPCVFFPRTVPLLVPTARQKPRTAVVKRDKTSGLDRNGHQKCYQKRFNKVLSFVVMGASEDFLHLTKQENWWFIYDTVLWLIVIHLSNSPVRSSILWVRVYHYRSVDLALSGKVNLFDMFPCCCCSSMAWTRCCLGVWKKDGGRCLGWWLSGSDITLRKSQGLVKKHSYFMQAVCTLLWTDCFETYMVVTYP